MTSKSNFISVVFSMLLLAGLAFVVGCTQQGQGFALPIGDLQDGKATFTKFNCNECHEVADIAWTGTDVTLKVPLGGEVRNLKTYGELVTSVINPSHKVSKAFIESRTNPDGSSRMKNYNDIMTVQELVDVVTFLQSEYEIETPPTYYYPY